jgi:hypothetical protein
MFLQYVKLATMYCSFQIVILEMTDRFGTASRNVGTTPAQEHR